MSDFLKLGGRGEALAWDFLKKQGYNLIEKNFRNRFGEVDIIAKKDGFLIFLEVKTRRDDRFGIGAESVDWRKRQKLTRVAQAYLQTRGLENRPARFDVLSVTWDGVQEPDFLLLEDAFTVET